MNNFLYDKIKELYNIGFSSFAIAKKLNISQRNSQRYIKHIKEDLEGAEVFKAPSSSVVSYPWQLSEDEKPDKRVVGIIGDLHQPFTSKEYLDFLVETFVKWEVTDIVFIGDIFDMSTLSRHPVEPDALGVPDEFAQTCENLEEYYCTFPIAKVCLGNHDSRLSQRASDSGIPTFCLKSMKELFNIPDTWEIADKWVIDNVSYIHGTQFNSRNILTTVANYTNGSLVMGHQHSLLGVVYNTNLFEKQSFAMAVGCGIDDSAYAFRYGKNNKMKSVIGCGIVISDIEAYAIPYQGGGE